MTELTSGGHSGPCTHRKAVNQYVMCIRGVPVLAVFRSVIITSGVNLLDS